MKTGMSSELEPPPPLREPQHERTTPRLAFSVEALMAQRPGTRTQADRLPEHRDRDPLLHLDREPTSPVKSETSDQEATWTKSDFSPHTRGSQIF